MGVLVNLCSSSTARAQPAQEVWQPTKRQEEKLLWSDAAAKGHRKPSFHAGSKRRPSCRRAVEKDADALARYYLKVAELENRSLRDSPLFLQFPDTAASRKLLHGASTGLSPQPDISPHRRLMPWPAAASSKGQRLERELADRGDQSSATSKASTRSPSPELTQLCLQTDAVSSQPQGQGAMTFEPRRRHVRKSRAKSAKGSRKPGPETAQRP